MGIFAIKIKLVGIPVTEHMHTHTQDCVDVMRHESLNRYMGGESSHGTKAYKLYIMASTCDLHKWHQYSYVWHWPSGIVPPCLPHADLGWLRPDLSCSYMHACTATFSGANLQGPGGILHHNNIIICFLHNIPG